MSLQTFSVQLVGAPDVVLLEGHSDYDVVAEAAGCEFGQVCLPIWRQGTDRWREHYLERCYHPRDDSGRQWIVRGPQSFSNPAPSTH